MITTGLDKQMAEFAALGQNARKIVSFSLYDGVAVFTAAMVDEMLLLPIDSNPKHPFTKPLSVISPRDKGELIKGLGVSKFYDTDSGRGVSISISGYTSRTERKYPGGVPLIIIARGIESGCSVRNKRPFWRKTEKAAETKVLLKIIRSANDMIKTTIEEA